MADPKTTGAEPPFDEAEAAGTPGDDRRDPGDNETSKTPGKPMSGAVGDGGEPLRNPDANRNPGPRQSGMTPRPTDEPLGE